jgi:hypothetical protein
MSTLERPAEEEVRKPTTFAELKDQAQANVACRRCGTVGATHTLSLTAARLGAGRGATVTQIQKVPVCEKCGVDIVVVVKRALKI